MAASRKYENLPDIDAAAPDVYETPELTDDVSTIPGTSAVSPSDGSEVDEASDGGIDRRRLRAQVARSKFQPSRVHAERVDFSDRLNLNQKSYRTHTSRRRPGSYDDAEEYGSGSDDDETLDSKLVRLRREVEQIKAAMSQQADDKPQASEDTMKSIEKISDALETMSTERRGTTRGPEAELSKTLRAFNGASIDKISGQPTSELEQTSRSRETQHSQTLQILSRTADFDSRLTLLESSLGINAANMPDSGFDTSKPILPTLQHLEQLIGTALAQPSQLEAAQTKTRQLLKEAERLARMKAEVGEQSDAPSTTTRNEESNQRTSDQESKINALYGLLPSIDTLSPTLPLLLDRLRTLRLLHTSAATANTTIEDIEQRQEEQADEIKQWRQAVEQVERNLAEGETILSDNMQSMGDMVKDLEQKLAKS